MAETRKTTTKKPSTTTKKTTTKKPSTTSKKTTAKKPSTTTKKTTTPKPKSSTTQTRKKTTKKSASTTKKPTRTSSSNKPKTTSKSVKNVEKRSNMTSPEVKTTKKPKTTTRKKTTKPKTQGRVKKQEELTTFEALEQQVDGKEIREKKPLGKTFYLVFSLIFYAAAFFYINFQVYDGTEYVQSAIFAFAALFVAFVLMLFNVHKLVFFFFILPFRRLFKQARQEAKKEIIFSVGKNRIQSTFNKYKSIFTLTLYFLFAGLLVYARVMERIIANDSPVQIVYSALITLLIYIVVINSWQFMFNIIPSILEKSIDAKNGYVLGLSAAVIVVYVMFMFFEINYLLEIMIFILIIGFVALLGVNLNMIVGEINIFQNLRGRKSKAVTRVVFVIFFGFHIYIILYASVVAYSIYNWEPEAYNFSEVNYIVTIDDDLYMNSTPIDEVYDVIGNEIDVAYDEYGIELLEYYDDSGMPIIKAYDETGLMITQFYDENSIEYTDITNSEGTTINNYFYYEGTLATITSVQEKTHEYSDFLYWTVISVSTIGYGDIAPSTEYPIAQAWGGFLGLYGLTFFALSISFVSNIAMEGVKSVRQENRQDDQ